MFILRGIRKNILALRKKTESKIKQKRQICHDSALLVLTELRRVLQELRKKLRTLEFLETELDQVCWRQCCIRIIYAAL